MHSDLMTYLSISCPCCGAATGAPCTPTKRGRLSDGVHPARKRRYMRDLNHRLQMSYKMAERVMSQT